MRFKTLFFVSLLSSTLFSAPKEISDAANYQLPYQFEKTKLFSFWLQHLDHTHPLIRKHAVLRLIDLRAFEALPSIEAKITDSFSGVRQAAVKAVGVLGEKDLHAPFLRSLAKREPDPTVKREIQVALDLLEKKNEMLAPTINEKQP